MTQDTLERLYHPAGLGEYLAISPEELEDVDGEWEVASLLKLLPP